MSHKNNLKRFTLDYRRLDPLLSSGMLKNLIYENNKWFKLEYGVEEDEFTVECENRPRDSQLLGVHWIEKQTPPE